MVGCMVPVVGVAGRIRSPSRTLTPLNLLLFVMGFLEGQKETLTPGSDPHARCSCSKGWRGDFA